MPRENLIQLRRGTTAQWTSSNPTLADGEPALNATTGRVKVGDGSTAWNDLPYSDTRVVELTIPHNLEPGRESAPVSITNAGDLVALLPSVGRESGRNDVVIDVIDRAGDSLLGGDELTVPAGHPVGTFLTLAEPAAVDADSTLRAKVKSTGARLQVSPAGAPWQLGSAIRAKPQILRHPDASPRTQTFCFLRVAKTADTLAQTVTPTGTGWTLVGVATRLENDHSVFMFHREDDGTTGPGPSDSWEFVIDDGLTGYYTEATVLAYNGCTPLLDPVMAAAPNGLIYTEHFVGSGLVAPVGGLLVRVAVSVPPSEIVPTFVSDTADDMTPRLGVDAPNRWLVADETVAAGTIDARAWYAHDGAPTRTGSASDISFLLEPAAFSSLPGADLSVTALIRETS